MNERFDGFKRELVQQGTRVDIMILDFRSESFISKSIWMQKSMSWFPSIKFAIQCY